MVSRPVSFKVFIFIAPLYETLLKALICCTFMRCVDFKNGPKICALRPRSDLYTNTTVDDCYNLKSRNLHVTVHTIDAQVPGGKPSNDDRAGVYVPLYERIKLY